MKKKFTKKTAKPSSTIPFPAPDPLPVPIPPDIPVTFSSTQPLPGIQLNVQSILRDVLERNLPPSITKKL